MPTGNGWAATPSNPWNTGLNTPGQPNNGNAIYSSSSGAPPTLNAPLVNQQQANTNFGTANYNKALNNNNVTTPWGSMTYQQTGVDPNTGAPIWSTNIGVNPAQQQALQAQQGNAASVNRGAGAGLVNQINQNSGQGLGVSMGDPAIQDAVRKSYAAQTGLLEPTFGLQKEQLDTQLANQGLAPGTDAYSNAKTLQAQQQNNAYVQAANTAEQQGIGLQSQMFGQQVTAQNNPLNQYLALNSGTQVQNPTFPTQNTSAAPGTNVLGGYQLGYTGGLNNSNYATGQKNSALSGIKDLGDLASTLYGNGKNG